MYLGQAMGQFAQGAMQGYAFVDNAMNDKVKREQAKTLYEQQEAMNQEKIAKAKRDNLNDQNLYNAVNSREQMQTVAKQQADAIQQNYAQQQQSYTSDEQKQQQREQNTTEILMKKLQKSNGTAMNSILNDIYSTSNTADREKQLNRAIRVFKDNTDFTQTLGIKNLDTADVLRLGNKKDEQYAIDYLAGYGIDAREAYTDPRKMEAMLDSVPVVKVDAQYIPLDHLTTATGGSKYLRPEQQDIIDSTREQITNSFAPRADSPDLTAEQEGNIDENNYLAKVANIETDGKDPYNQPQNRNGYEGKYQFRYRDEGDAGYAIAKELGIDPKAPKTPEQQEAIMRKFTDTNRSQLDARGIESTDYNLWLAHNQGVGGANAILKGKLTPTIRRNIKNQGIVGNTDTELINNYHEKFAPRFGEQPQQQMPKEAKKRMIADVAQSTDNFKKPIDDDKLAHLYALAGKTDPRASDEKMTSFMKNYAFMTGTLGMEKDQAVKSLAKKERVSPLKKAIREQEVLRTQADKAIEDGDFARADQLNAQADTYTPYIDKTAKGTTAVTDERNAEEIKKRLNWTFDPNKEDVETESTIEAEFRDSKGYNSKVVKSEAEFKAMADLLPQLNKLRKDMASPKWDSGLVDTVWEKGKGMLIDDIAKQTTQQIMADQGISYNAANYLKLMSGSSATDKEYQDKLKTIAGTSDMQPSQRLAILDSFISQNKMAMRTQGESLAKSGLPRLYRDYASHFADEKQDVSKVPSEFKHLFKGGK